MPAAIISAQRVEVRLLVCLTKPVKLNVRRLKVHYAIKTTLGYKYSPSLSPLARLFFKYRTVYSGTIEVELPVGSFLGGGGELAKFEYEIPGESFCLTSFCSVYTEEVSCRRDMVERVVGNHCHANLIQVASR